jgi:proteasome lid subunit RPN8/RPN11
LGPLRQRLTLHRHSRENPRPADCNVIMRQSLYRKIVSHLKADTTRERGGLLLGYEEHLPNLSRPTVVVVEALPAQHTEASVTRLTFTLETWAEFERQTDALRERGFNYRRVGWYHSHPGHGIFLSAYDLNVCADFPSPTQVALVIDPISNDGGFFVRGESGYRSDAPQGFWEWPDSSNTSIVEWRSLRMSDANWEGPLPDELGRDAGEKESSLAAEQPPPATETSGRVALLPADTWPPVAATSPPNADPSAVAIGEQTAIGVPYWLAALALGVPTLALIALAFFSYRTNKALTALAEETQDQKKDMRKQKEETRKHSTRLDALQALIESLKPESTSAVTNHLPEGQSQVNQTPQAIQRGGRAARAARPSSPPTGGKPVTEPPAGPANAAGNTGGAPANAPEREKANNGPPGNTTPADAGKASGVKQPNDKDKTDGKPKPTPTPSKPSQPETPERRPLQ